MNRYLILIFLLFPIVINAQDSKNMEPKDTLNISIEDYLKGKGIPIERPEPKNISNILSYEDFQQIKQFVLDKGKSAPCTNRTNWGGCPFYQFEDNFELVLINPIFPFNDRAEKNTIVISTTEIPIIDIYIQENIDTKQIYLTSYGDFDTEEIMNKQERKIREFIPTILKEIDRNK